MALLVKNSKDLSENFLSINLDHSGSNISFVVVDMDREPFFVSEFRGLGIRDPTIVKASDMIGQFKQYLEFRLSVFR